MKNKREVLTLVEVLRDFVDLRDFESFRELYGYN